MTTRYRFLPPLAAALLLGAALVLRFFWPAPDVGEPADTRMPPMRATGVAAPEPAPQAAAPVKPEPVNPVKEALPASVAEIPRATVVPTGPGDVVPEPEVANPLPQSNEPIEPEKPQTPAWRHGKLVRITELLDRDVERLEQERVAAEKRGDAAEAKRLEVRIMRHRARLTKLRDETAALSEADQ